MINSEFNPELYQEMLSDNGCQYQDDIQNEMIENYLCDYL